ncbi:Hsp33 family molecular chaperone HslO [Niveispirillum sp.]|uniref:Hsp33 family molecular chaperone HslO n=1 Tax=Niveispirillum sp. TaxID=1917217 RepID=UPI001B50F0D5|nr:Hsp33 family molecular chaperone HslO [Niveispirillum sp.]MBP7339026.1 Hsp33 family molecular chaperone HslO [Niveispirillum sp.]
MTSQPPVAGHPRHDTNTVTAEFDVCQPFQLDSSSFRGRLIRLGPALDEIIKRHNYPDELAPLLADTILLAATLASSLKYDGIFTLQTKGDGPVAYTVSDVTSVGDLRGYARFDADRLAEQRTHKGFKADLGSLLGAGYVAFTVDQGEHTERYQGIVELRGATLADAVRHYFRQSEQLAASIKSFVSKDADGKWVGGAIMLQALPPENAGTFADHQAGVREEDWHRAGVLLETVTAHELLDPALSVNELIFRLFHEESPRIYERRELRPGCRCSRERVTGALRSIERTDLDDMRIDGVVAVSCEFCNATYTFNDAELDEVYAGF